MRITIAFIRQTCNTGKFIKTLTNYFRRVSMIIGFLEELPDSYVLFLCDFDPFGLEKYRYTVRQMIAEDETFPYQDGSCTIFLSTKGKNEGEVSRPLVQLMKYVAAGLNESTADFGDEYVAQLQETVQRVKASREIGGRYMLLEEMLKDERAEGIEEGKAQGIAQGIADAVLQILKAYGEVPEDLANRIRATGKVEELKKMLACAVSVKSISEFKSMTNL